MGLLRATPADSTAAESARFSVDHFGRGTEGRGFESLARPIPWTYWTFPVAGISASANLDAFGAPYLEIYRALAGNDRKGAVALHTRLLPLINFMMQSLEFVIQCEKTVLCWGGIVSSDSCRRPSMRLTAHDLHSLRERFESTVPHIAKKT
jgi:hypothetical protein